MSLKISHKFAANKLRTGFHSMMVYSEDDKAEYKRIIWLKQTAYWDNVRKDMVAVLPGPW